MKNYRFWLIVFILLVVVNCGVLTMLWLHTQRPRQGRPGGDAKSYLIKELKLNTTQVKQYNAMAQQHFEFTSKVNEEGRALHDQLFEGLRDTTISPAQTAAVEKQIVDHQMMVDTATFNHFKKLRSILNTEQKARFDQIIQNVLHMMAGPHPQGGRPGQGRPQGAPPQPNTSANNQPPAKASAAPDKKHLPPCDPRIGPPPRGERPGPDDRPPYGPPPGGPPPDGPPPTQ